VVYTRLYIVALHLDRSTVTVETETEGPCRVYCAAYPVSSSPASVTGLGVRHSLYAGRMDRTSVAQGTMVINVTISGLQPMTPYRVHCYTEDWELPPNAMPDWKVRTTYRLGNTSCCNAFEPPALPQNMRQLHATSPVTLKMPQPGVTLTINASYCANVTGPADCAPGRLPARTTCASDPLQRLIRINPGPVMGFTSSSSAGLPLSLYPIGSGCFILNYTLTGDAIERGFFGALTGSARAIRRQQGIYAYAAQAPLAAPNISWARLSATGAEVEIGFAYETDRAGLSGTFPCGQLLNYTAGSLLHRQITNVAQRQLTACRWRTSTVAIATLAVNATLLPGDYVSLKPSQLRARCDSTTACEDWPTNPGGAAVMIEHPLSPILPVPVVSYSASQSPCSDMRVDASASSGSAGRPLYYYWLVTGGTQNISSFLISAGINPRANMTSWAQGAHKGTPLLRIPRRWLDPGTSYTVRLFLYNFLGASAYSSAVTVRVEPYGNGTSAAPVASVQILPASSPVEIRRWDPLVLFASCKVSFCVPDSYVAPAADNLGMVYSWSIVGKQQTALQSLSTDPRYFTLAPTTLVAGGVYTVTVRVNVTLRWGVVGAQGVVTHYVVDKLLASGSVPVKVLTSQPLLEIRGGNRVIGSSTPLTLDARYSIDPDNLRGGASALNITWVCIRGGDKYGQRCNLPSTVQGLRPYVGVLPEPGTYIFTAVASTRRSDQGGQYASSAVTITVTDQLSFPPLAFAYRHPTLSIYSYVPGQVNPSAKIALSGSAFVFNRTENLSVSWELADGSLATPGLTLADVATTPVRSAGITVNARSTVPWSLALPPGSLLPGTTYIFRLVIANGVYRLPAEVQITTNSPPTSGTVTVTPSAGTALATHFDVLAVGWLDQPEDYPLRYDFYVDDDRSRIYNDTDDTVAWRYMLAYGRYLPLLENALLPMSPVTGSVVVATCAKDSYNATACTPQGAVVGVESLPRWSGSVMKNVSDAFAAAMAVQDVDAASAVVLMALISLRAAGPDWLPACRDGVVEDCTVEAVSRSLMSLALQAEAKRDPTVESVQQQAAILDLVLSTNLNPTGGLDPSTALHALQSATAKAALTGFNGNLGLVSRLACAVSGLLHDGADDASLLVASQSVKNLARATWTELVPLEPAIELTCPRLTFSSKAFYGVNFVATKTLSLGVDDKVSMPLSEVGDLLGTGDVEPVDEVYTSLVVMDGNVHKKDGNTSIDSVTMRLGLRIRQGDDAMSGRRRRRQMAHGRDLAEALTTVSLATKRPNQLEVCPLSCITLSIACV
jgi:hypothetical protein